MSTTQEIVTDALRLIGAIDIAEAAPSPAEMTFGLRILGRMVDAWAGQGLNVVTQTLSGARTSGSPIITGLASTLALAPGLNVAGTGLPSARILSIDSRTQVTLDADALSDGTDDITFTAVPFQARFEQGVVALLALRLASPGQIIPDYVRVDADAGWAALQANFMLVPAASFDPALTMTSAQRVSAGMLNDS